MLWSDGSTVTIIPQNNSLLAMLGSASNLTKRYCQAIVDSATMANGHYYSNEIDTAITELPGGPTLQYPLSVQVIRQDDCIIINSIELEIFGYGNTLMEAEDDFAESIRQLFAELQENRGYLSHELESNRLRLEKLFISNVSKS